MDQRLPEPKFNVLLPSAPRRDTSRVLIGMIAESGGGKTFSSVELAKGLAGDGLIVAVDTEDRRMLQSDAILELARQGSERFRYCEFPQPWGPKRYLTALEEVQQLRPKVLILDSVSHEWAYDGGVLEEAENAGAFTGNLAGWRAPKAAHSLFMRRLRGLGCHVIANIRAKRKIQFVDRMENGRPVIVNGKKKQDIVDLGLQPIQSPDFAFELTVQMFLRLDKPGFIDHTPGKLKCPGSLLFAFPHDKPVSQETGRLVTQWLTQRTADEDALIGLKSRAEAAAARGYAALETFWYALPPEHKRLLKPYVDGYKEAAANVDLQRRDEALDDAARGAPAPADELALGAAPVLRPAEPEFG